MLRVPFGLISERICANIVQKLDATFNPFPLPLKAHSNLDRLETARKYPGKMRGGGTAATAVTSGFDAYDATGPHHFASTITIARRGCDVMPPAKRGDRKHTRKCLVFSAFAGAPSRSMAAYNSFRTIRERDHEDNDRRRCDLSWFNTKCVLLRGPQSCFAVRSGRERGRGE
jgi:hypothetical protein